MDKFSIKSNLNNTSWLGTSTDCIKPKKDYGAMQRTLSTTKIPNKLNQQSDSQLKDTISITSRTASHKSAATLLKDSKPVDVIIDFWDLSKTSIKGIKEFLKTSGAKKWAEQYVQHLKDGKILAMPGMAETTEKMKKVIADFKALYNQMKFEECEALTILQSALDINAANGYPSYDSELLAKKFCVLRDLLVLKYGKKGDPQWPKESGRDYSTSDFGKSKEKLATLDHCSQTILLDKFLIGTESHLPIHYRYPFYHEIIATLEKGYESHFCRADSVRILVMDDLCVDDFNQTAGLPITYLGLLQNTSLARHDNLEFLSYPFLVHDGYHASLQSRSTSKQKSIIYSVMSEYYNKLKPVLDDEVAKIAEYLFFSTLHEKPVFFYKEKSIQTAISETLIGFGLRLTTFNKIKAMFLTRPLSRNHEMTSEEASIVKHLEGTTDVACHAVKIYKFFFEQAISAESAGNTQISKLKNESEISGIDESTQTIESLAKKISAAERHQIGEDYIRPLLPQVIIRTEP